MILPWCAIPMMAASTPTFGGDGIITTQIGASAAQAYSVTIHDGKILVAGSASNGSNNDFALARYNSDDGSLDLNFGVGGICLRAHRDF